MFGQETSACGHQEDWPSPFFGGVPMTLDTNWSDRVEVHKTQHVHWRFDGFLSLHLRERRSLKTIQMSIQVERSVDKSAPFAVLGNRFNFFDDLARFRALRVVVQKVIQQVNGLVHVTSTLQRPGDS
ncbi:MAG TPA: hypothetical protein VF040_09955 [Ktedonobacterales bacterium]